MNFFSELELMLPMQNKKKKKNFTELIQTARHREYIQMQHLDWLNTSLTLSFNIMLCMYIEPSMQKSFLRPST